jgi:hypothetical protein
MKHNRLVLIAILFSSVSQAQITNWSSFNKPQRQIINVNIAADYGLTYGVGYAYRLKSKKPLVLNAEYSFPSGKNLTDDFKTKAGAEFRWLQSGNFQFASKLQGVFRRYDNSYARLLNFGADLSSTAGYYKHHWFAAVELGFDKAIITHFKHSDLYKANFPGVKDGWYEPSTGGNIYFGIRGGWSGKNKDVYLKIGKVEQQDLKESPMLPVYAQLGFNLRLH